jgi:hypothetical protein
MIKIRTNNGHECFIEKEDLKHYVDATVLEDEEVEVEEPEDE